MGCTQSSGTSTAVADPQHPDDAPVSSQPAENVGSDFLLPECGFVVKTKRADNMKAFVNVFHHSSVLYLLTFPARIAADKAGEDCVTYDVVINTAVFTICVADNEAKIFVRA